MSLDIKKTPLICVGCGGISYGWMPQIMHAYVTGALPFKSITLIDGKKFDAHHRTRQHGVNGEYKVKSLKDQWTCFYPPEITLPISCVCEYVDERNIVTLIPDGSAILCSPDNHETRRLLTNHLSTLKNGLLIVGGNGAISEDGDLGSMEGSVLVHFRQNSRDVTPSLTTHHPDIAKASRPVREIGCDELGPGLPQVLITNFMVGALMVQLLWRFLNMREDDIVQTTEVWFDLEEFDIASYGSDFRPVILT